MSRSNAVWGIDVGNCSLKALRCYVDDSNPTKIVADAGDYIEYPMILTQTGANPDELIHEALTTFLSRNKIHGDKIVVSVAGQNGLVRFIKLPPIEARRIPDIVRYEAKQQIPFDLNDVIWDYQRLGKDAEDGGIPLEVEIGLFAMKREQAFHMLDPYEDMGIPVDCLQLSPLALYNYLMADEMKNLPSVEDYDPENPPPYVVLLSMGTDATDLILTNGFGVWQRNLPIGGSHFTKALTKELKLTFAKADHLKRNLAASQDKVAVLKAMQPVFNNLQNEIQRSLGFYSNMDRHAQYERVIALGNPMKLTGLTTYLSQNLGVQVKLASSFPGLDTSQLLDSPGLTENLPTFGVCYGLCLQGLKRGAIRTNLLPPEITRTRIINEKKPWAVAALALMMLGATVSYGMHISVGKTVAPDHWQRPESQAKDTSTEAETQKTNLGTAQKELTDVLQVGQNLVAYGERRLSWLELLRGINECLPRGKQQAEDEIPTEESIRNRPELHIMNIESQKLTADLKATWLERTAKWRPKSQGGTAGEDGEEDMESTPAAGAASATPAATGSETPVAAGASDGESGSSEDSEVWLVSVTGLHYHNGENLKYEGALYVRETFIRNVLEKEFILPKPTVLMNLGGEEAPGAEDAEETPKPKTPAESPADGKKPKTPAAEAAKDGKDVEMVTMADLGVSSPVLVNPGMILRGKRIRNPYLEHDSAMASRGTQSGPRTPTASVTGYGGATTYTDGRTVGENPEEGESIRVSEFNFTVHFLWEPKTPAQREKIREVKEAAKKAAKEAENEEMEG